MAIPDGWPVVNKLGHPTAPKKKRGRPKGWRKYPPECYDANGRIKFQPSDKPTGRPKGSRNSPEIRAKSGQSISATKWRKRAPNTGSPSMQSSSGWASGADYSTPAIWLRGTTYRRPYDDWDPYSDD